jgi:hypothetical protein
MMLNGLQVIVSASALEATDERLFPVSKNRSKRIHKKLVKRFGGEFRQRPAIFRTPTAFIMHPSMYARLCAELDRQP